MSSVDSIYYRSYRKVPFATKVCIAARQKIHSLFLREMQPDASTTILDIGASDVEGDEANMLEKMYTYKNKITSVGLGAGEEFKRRYPEVHYIQIEAGNRLPFDDKQFDIAYSNAVLEHVGGPTQRRHFIQEALRVAKSVFIVVPNRWFPIEHHTGWLLIHYNPWLFQALADNWPCPELLDFLSKRKLRREWPKLSAPKFAYTGIWLGPLSSNLAMIVKK